MQISFLSEVPDRPGWGVEVTKDFLDRFPPED